ncbi:MAG TPA: thioredoxin [Candidatus Cloacimonadota bacterium]|nr:thioredoxin [Candidatus Cloacimonadota bacterium]
MFFLFAEEPVELEHLTAETFKAKVFDYDNNTEWSYKGELPAIIDFYADWCGPCKRVAPIMVELSQQYENKLIIYKVNTDDEQNLSSMFGIRSIPSILFIPLEGQPTMITGAYPKEEMVKIINEVLKVQ